jgi:GNAT superfamily N-acetyltransferase
MDVTIRRATVSDAQGIVDVINSIIEEGELTSLYPALTLEQEESYIEELGPRGALFVAELSGEILGVQSIEPYATYTRAMDHVASIGTYIYRNLRRRGVGRRLFEATLGFAREQGYEKIVIAVRIGNSVAQAFYRMLGFIPKMMLERQVKIDGRYDDEVWMELFVPAAEAVAAVAPEPEAATAPVQAPASAAAPPPEPVAAPARKPVTAAEPVVQVPQPPVETAPAIDPTVGAVTVRRAKRGDVRTLAAIMKGTMRWRPPPTEGEVLEMLFDKGYWLAMSRKGGGVTGWRAENLVMCIDDFYVYPPQFYPQVGAPLLETVETEAKALSCEVAMVFLDERVTPQAIQFFESQGYERQEQDELFSVWREVSQEFLQENMFMMVKKLREKRIMRPL